jgi:hypothetical protein
MGPNLEENRGLSTESAVYLYAIVRSVRRPAVNKAPDGLPHTGPVRALDAGRGVWLLVADAPLARYGEAPIEEGLKDLDWVSACAMAHEAVVRHFARRLTTVPMRLFTLFRSDERALEHARRSRARLSRALTRIDGCEEWGVRLFASEDAPRPAPRGPKGPDAGRRFLEQKRAQHLSAREGVTAAAGKAQSVVRALGRNARAHRALAVPPVSASSRLVAEAAFLVRREGRQRFRTAVTKAVTAGRASGLRLDLTGPWPAYNFVDAAR